MDAGTDAGVVASCTVCTGVTCDTLPLAVQCSAGQTVCTTQTDDEMITGRTITRGCSTFAAAETSVAANPPECSTDAGDVHASGTVCVFACDGVNFPNCNHPPEVVPDAGVLFDGGQ